MESKESPLEIENVKNKSSPNFLQYSDNEFGRSETLAQHLAIRDFIVMIGIVGVYYATMVHLVGSGLLAQAIGAAVGGSSQVTWITLALIIVSATLGPSIALAADLWGRKWVIVMGLTMAVAGAIVVSRAKSIGVVFVGQAIAGFGQPSQAICHAIVSEILPRKYRPYAQITIQIAIALSAVTALYVGGALCKTNPEGFRNFFYMVAAIFFVTACIFTFLYRPPPRELQKLTLREKLRRFDYGGTILTICFLGICIGLGWSQNPYPWSNLHVWLPFMLGALSVIALVIYATWIKRDGIYHRELFTSRNFIIAELGLFAEGFLFVAFNNFVPYQISFLFGKDLFQTAVEYSVAWLVDPIGAAAVAIFATRTKTMRPPMVVAFLFMTGFFGTMAGTNLNSNNEVTGIVALYGLALGAGILILVVLAQLSVPPELIAPATGLLMATRALGGTVGLAVYNALFNAAVSGNLAAKVSAVAIPLGLPPSSIGQLLAALVADDQQDVLKIPGITLEIILASTKAMKEAFNIAFQHVYIMSASMAALASIVALFIKEAKNQFNSEVDAPLFKTHAPKHKEEAV